MISSLKFYPLNFFETTKDYVQSQTLFLAREVQSTTDVQTKISKKSTKRFLQTHFH